MIPVKALRLGLLSAASWLLASVSALAQTTHFVVTQAGGTDPLSIGSYTAGTSFDVRIEARNADDTVDTTNNQDVTLTIEGLPVEISAAFTATLVAGVADPVTITSNLAGTNNLRIKVTDGRVVDADASGFFSATPASYNVSLTGSDTDIGTNTIIDGRPVAMRVTAFNADFSLAMSYTGDVTLTSTALGGPITATVVNGIADNVIGVFTAGLGSSIDADDGITAVSPASATFDVQATPVTGAGLTLTETAVTSSNHYPGRTVVVRYQLNNATGADIADPDVLFEAIDSDDRVQFRWWERLLGNTVVDTKNSGRQFTSFTLPFWAAAGSWTIRIRPGGSAANEATVNLTILGQPDLVPVSLVYTPGTYRAGSAMRFELTFGNQALMGRSPFNPSSRLEANAGYRVEVHLSRDTVFGGSDDFLLWQTSFTGNPNGGYWLPGAYTRIADNFILPQNYAGTYYLVAKVNSAGGPPDFAGGVAESVGPAQDGNNSTIGIEAAKLTILPEVAPDISRVSQGSSAASTNPALSQDGRFTAFESRGQITGTTTANLTNIYVRDNVTGTTRLVTTSTSGGAANGSSYQPTISSDGRYVAYQSEASNLVIGDTNGAADIFVTDVVAGTTRRVSLSSTGAQGNGFSTLPSISGNGRWIAFESLATNLVASPATPVGIRQIYVYDRDVAGTGVYDSAGNTGLKLVTQLSGVAATASSAQPRISRDGAYVAFQTVDTALVDNPSVPFSQIVRWERTTGDIVVVTFDGSVLGNQNSSNAAINADGSVIAFISRAQNLDSTLTSADYTAGIPHVFRAVLAAGAVSEIRRINAPGGIEPNATNTLNIDIGAFEPSLSDDGNLVAFASVATNLLSPISVQDIDDSPVVTDLVQNYQDSNEAADIYLFDATSGSVTRESVGTFGYEATIFTTAANTVTAMNPYSRMPVLSGDGRYLAFASDAFAHFGLLFGATNFDYVGTSGTTDIYLRDRKTTPAFTETDPAIALRMPVSQTVSANGTVQLIADATSVAGTISAVEFYADSQLIATVTNPVIANTGRYLFTWTPSSSANRIWQINAVAVDSRGIRSTLSSTATVTVSNIVGALPPVVSLVSPASGDSLTSVSTSRITALASDPDGNLTSVEFFVNGISVGTSTRTPSSTPATFPFSVAWAPGVPGVYTIYAVASDLAGNRTVSSTATVTSEVGITPPTAIVSVVPSSALTLGGRFVVSASALDSDGAVQSVSFYANGTLIGTDLTFPYSIEYTPATAGLIEFVAVARDDSGNRTASVPVSRTVNLPSGVPPSVALVSPASAGGTNQQPTRVQIGSQATINLIAQVTSGTASTTGVEFFALSTTGGGVLLGSGTLVSAGSGRYQLAYTNALAPGNYEFIATVTDAVGNVVQSAGTAVSIVASSSATTVTLSAPGTSTIVANQSTTLTATTTTGSGVSVSAVAFYVNGTLSATDASAPFDFSFSSATPGVYTISAVATDSLLNTALSNTQTITVVANTAPTVALVNPTSAVSLTLGSSLALEAQASDTDGTIVNVSFYVDGSLVATGFQGFNTTNYQATWTPTVARVAPYVLTVRATDNQGAVTTSSTSVNVTVTEAVGAVPTVSLDFALFFQEIRVGSDVRLSATVTDTDRNFDRVDFFVDGVLVGSSTVELSTMQALGVFVPNQAQADYAVNWVASTVGTHSVVAVAHDTAGNIAASTAVTVTVLPLVAAGKPTVTLTTPSGNTSILIGELLKLVASANDTAGTLDRVDFYANGQLYFSDDSAPYEGYFQVTNFKDVGLYQVYAVAVDVDGNEAVSNSVLVDVSTKIAPFISVGTNNLFVRQVLLDGDQTIELNAGDPIKYTVAYGRSIASGTGNHGDQRFRVSVYLSTDGDPENGDNFLLDFTDNAYPQNENIGRLEGETFYNRLPSNFSGTYYLIAKVRVTGGQADSNADDDFPSVFRTATARITIRPSDSPVLTRISETPAGTSPASFSESASISADGRYVVFQSQSPDIVASPAVPTGVLQVYLRDTVTNQTTLVSQYAGAAGNAASTYPVISSTGTVVGGARRYYVAYQSAATNLISGNGNLDTNARTDIFVYDVSAGTTTRVSVPSGAPSGAQANQGSFFPSISADGRYVTFESDATNLIPSGSGITDTNGQRDVYVFDRTTKVVSPVSVTAAGTFGSGASSQAQISADGSTIVFRSFARNLGASVLPNSYARSVIYAKNRATGAVSAISLVREAVGAGVASYTALDDDAYDPAVSADGRYVAFASRSAKIPPYPGSAARNTAKISQVYVVNRQVDASSGVNPSSYDQTGNVGLMLVSSSIDPVTGLTSFGEDESVAPVINGDGRFVGFRTEASNLQPLTVVRSDGITFRTEDIAFFADTNNTSDVYVRDTGITSYQVTSGGSGYPAGDIPFVVSTGGGEAASAVAIVEDGVVTRVDVISTGYGYHTAPAAISIPGGAVNAVVTPVLSSGSERVSISQFGQQTIGIIGSTTVPASRDIAISQDGRYMVFTSAAHNTAGFVFGKSNLSPRDQNSQHDVFMIDRRIASSTASVAGVAPTVTLALNQTTLTAGSQLVAFVTATDGLDIAYDPSGAPSEVPGVITSLQIIANGQPLTANSISSDTSYGVLTAPRTTGPIEVYAVAVDQNGNRTFSNRVTVTVTASTAAAPTVTLAAPVPATAFANQSVLLSAATTVSSGATLTNVQFFSNGNLVGTDATAPYTLAFSAAAANTYSIYAVATDSLGNTGVSAPVSVVVTGAQPPTVSVGSTSNSIVLGSTLEITANAADTDGTISSVVFNEYFGSVSGTPNRTVTDLLAPYSYQFSPSQAGTYLIVAEATDNQGNTTSSSAYQIVVAANPVRPTVTFVAPVNGATAVVGQATSVEVSVAVATGASVNSVNFYANGTLIGSGFPQGTTGRYRLLVQQGTSLVPWQPSVTGTLALTAEAIDSFGGRGETAVGRLLNVVNQVGALPFVEIIQPVVPTGTGGNAAASVPMTTNSDLYLAANAVDSDDSIASVEYFLDRGRQAVATATVTFPSIIVGGVAFQQTTGYISAITVTDPGTGYLSPPTVTIVGDGVGATAEADIVDGAISRIRITNRGSGYTNAVVRFVGGGLVEGLSIGLATRDFSSDVWRLPTPYNFRTLGAGFYTFRALAKDQNNNAQYSDTVSVTVSAAPLTTPTTGLVTSTPSTSVGSPVPAGQTVQLSLSPTVVGGTVASVEFFANGESVGRDTTAPFVVNWVPGYVGGYNVVGVVTDSAGNKGVSPALAVYVGGNLAPTVTLVRPGSGGSIAVVNQQFLLEAEAVAQTPGASIASVEFILNGVSLGLAQQVGTSNRFILSTWSPTSTGNFTVLARVVDSFSQTASSVGRVITVIGQVGVKPTVVMTSPAAATTGGTGNGVAISNNSSVVLAAQANDADGTVSGVQFLLTRGRQATATARLVLGDINTNLIFRTDQVLAIVVNDGGAGYLYPPTVTIVGNGVGATAEAVLQDGVVVAIRVLTPGSGYTAVPEVLIEGGGLYEDLVIADGTRLANTLTWSHTLDLRTVDVGPYSFRARVMDNSGNTSLSNSLAVTVTAATSNVPSVELTVVPASVSTVSSTVISARATDTDGAIDTVQFYANGVLLGEGVVDASGTNFSLTLPVETIRSLGTGDIQITAVATDTTNNAAISAPRTMRIVDGSNSIAPTVAFLYGPATTTSESDLLITVSAGDADGKVTAVELFANGRSLGLGTKLHGVEVWQFIIRRDVTRTIGVGDILFSAVATDNQSNTSIVEGTLPITQAASPGPASITLNVNKTEFYFGDTINFTSQVVQNAGRVDLVTYFISGAPAPTFDEFNSPNPSTVAPSYRYLGQLIIGGYRDCVAVGEDVFGNQVVSEIVTLRSAGRNGVLPGLNPFGSPEDFVKQVFADLLRRGPGEAEVAQFAAIARASGYGAALDAMLDLSEFIDVREAAAISYYILGKWPTYEKLAEYTDRLRGVQDPTDDIALPRPGGIPPLATADRALRVASLMQFLFDGGDYEAAYGSLPDMTINAGSRQLDNVRIFVNRLYRNMFGKDANNSDVLMALTTLNTVTGVVAQDPNAVTVITASGTFAYRIYDAYDNDRAKIQLAGEAASLVTGFCRRVPTTAEVDTLKVIEGAARYDVLKVNADYINRFTFFSGATDLGSGWRSLPWFGKFYVKNARWIYHETLGWLYVPASSNTEESIYLWDPTLRSWLWTTSSTFPWLYRYSDTSWIYYRQGSKIPRYFYNGTTRQWEFR